MLANFEDFCLMCYVTIDDCYRALPACSPGGDCAVPILVPPSAGW